MPPKDTCHEHRIESLQLQPLHRRRLHLRLPDPRRRAFDLRLWLPAGCALPLRNALSAMASPPLPDRRRRTAGLALLFVLLVPATRGQRLAFERADRARVRADDLAMLAMLPPALSEEGAP